MHKPNDPFEAAEHASDRMRADETDTPHELYMLEVRGLLSREELSELVRARMAAAQSLIAMFHRQQWGRAARTPLGPMTRSMLGQVYASCGRLHEQMVFAAPLRRARNGPEVA